MQIAVLIPCYNEEATIAKVINDFRRQLPDAQIYVYDNNSSDGTYQIALQAGAKVRKETHQGKGNVVKYMFRYIEADVYIMVDGDDTYPAEYVHNLIKPILDKEADMVTGDRISKGYYKNENKRPMHNMGNSLVSTLINFLFKTQLKDIMTGYRAFNRSFIKNIPIITKGFEIETEMTIKALDNGFVVKEVPVEYRDRPAGSASKLNTVKDGTKVLKTIFTVFKDYRPIQFFVTLAMIFFVAGILDGIPVINEYIEYGAVYKIPSAILSVALILLSAVMTTIGLILDTVVKFQKENYEVHLKWYYTEKDTMEG